MKNLFLSLVLVMVGLVANSQVITVNVHESQKFIHSSSISTVNAMKLDVIEYPYYTVGENTLIFDLKNKTLTIKNLTGVSTGQIVEINKSENILDCIVMYKGSRVLFLMGKTTDNSNQFLLESVNGDKIEGQFSMNSDFNYSVK